MHFSCLLGRTHSLTLKYKDVLLEIKKVRKKKASRQFGNTSLTLRLARAEEKARRHGLFENITKDLLFADSKFSQP